jgi:RNA polymerase sigma factor for flagellar operon FliA
VSDETRVAPEQGRADVGPAGADGARSRAALRELLWDAYRANPCDGNRNLLVESYRGIVTDVVRRFALRLPQAVERGDLETAGSVGLIAAVAAFEPQRGIPFEIYCERRVCGAVVDELRNMDCLTRAWRTRLQAQRDAASRLRARLEREPTDEQIAEELGLSAEEYAHTFGVRLNGLASASHSEALPGDPEDLGTLPDLDADEPGEALTREELLDLIAQRLSPIESKIVYLRYWDDQSMREIGEIVSLSESRVCKIHARLLERLSERLRSQVA